MLMKSRFIRTSILLIISMLPGCQMLNNSGPSVLSGTISYRERMALPPNAKLEVILADIAKQDAPYEEVARFDLSPAGQVPIAYRIPYDAKNVKEEGRYALMARITQDGHLLFINDMHYAVDLKQAQTRIDMVLKRVSGN